MAPQAQSASSISDAAMGVHVMVKPIGPICNLDCEYCYYLKKEDLYPGTKSWRMRSETLRDYIRQHIAAQPAGVDEITFAWQGGEPTLLGVEFFREANAIQKELAPPGVRTVNTMQTNGTLLDDEWCAFFKQENWLIGLSMDGPAELHDHYRFDKQGKPTFAQVHRGLQLLKRHEVEFNVLVVVNRHNGDAGRRVYTYLRDNGAQYMQFIPAVEPLEGHHPGAMKQAASTVSPRSVLPEQWGRFLVDVFDEWIRRDVGKVFVQIFDQALSAHMGIEPSLCVFRKQCGRALAMEHNGDVYSCDHFVEEDYRLGNIQELPLVEMVNSARQQEFGRHKETSLPEYCRSCEVLEYCRGECPKNRILQTPEGAEGLNYLCQGYRRFFNHIRPYLEQMAIELRAGRHPANVMHQLRRTGESAPVVLNRPGQQFGVAAGRNDPCPCGSGKKFKKCCMK
ncbi:MAG: anaerobic sulfatase maturase [Planctomycetaceae bacterium]|nr:anaerobic sulfatase maturase [Planctomycetaceae bacterium]